MVGFLIVITVFSVLMGMGFAARFTVLERGKPASAIKAIVFTVIGICVSSSLFALLFAGGKAVSDNLWGVDEQLAVESESGTGSVGDEADGGELVESEKEEPGAGGGSSESDPPVWVIAGVGGGVLFAAAIGVVAVRGVRRGRQRREVRVADCAFVESRLEALSERIGRVCAEYAQAHVDPEVVLYKPLLIGNSDEAYEFVDTMADAQLSVESDKEWLKGVGSSPVDRDSIKDTEDKVRKAEQLWRHLNRKAEQVGTPILDTDVLRRAERLWGLATNESATVGERKSAMGKLEELVAGCRRELSQKDMQSQELCDVISAQIARGKTQGIIAAPGPVVSLPGASVLALEK